MHNSHSNYIINDSIRDIFRLKPKNKILNIYNKKNNYIPPKKQYNRNNYLTINLEKTNKETEHILPSPIYQTIKKYDKNVISTQNSLTKNRNIFLENEHDYNEKMNKNIYMSTKIKIRNRIIFKDNTFLSLINVKSNNGENQLKYSKSNKCYTEKVKNFKNRNKMINPIFQKILNSNKSSNGKYFTNNNSIKKTNRINDSKILEEMDLNKKFNKINNNEYRKNITVAKENNNKIKRKKLKNINVKAEKTINENDNFKKNLLFNRIYNDSEIYKNKNLNKSLNAIIKSKGIDNIKRIYRNQKNYKENLIKTKSFRAIYSSIFSKNSIDILNKIFKKRRIKIWKDIKYRIFETKYYNNKIFNVQSISYNNFQNKNNFLKEQLLDDISQDNLTFLKNSVNSKNNIHTKDIYEIFSHHDPANKLEKSVKNKIIDDSENQELKSKLKTIYLKYLLEKKKNRNKEVLLKSLYKINKNIIIINNNKNRKKKLLKKIIEHQEQNKKNILRIYFIKFHFICRLFNQKRKFYCFKNFQNDFILMQKLYNIIYQKEKNNALSLKKYFDRFRNNTIIIEDNNRNLIEVIDHNKILINKRNLKLKLIITKINKHNNIIIINILKQWFLRTKIFKINDDDNINNIRKKNIQKEDLIKGINILNYIFKIYKDKKNSNNNKKNEKMVNINEQKEIIIMNNKNVNDLIEKNKYLKKLCIEKYKTESIIEEKEEEQTEE